MSGITGSTAVAPAVGDSAADAETDGGARRTGLRAAIEARLSRVIRNPDFREVLLATAGAFIFKIGGAACSFLLGFIVARRYGAQGSGVFALATTVVTIAVTFSLFGLDYASVRAVSSNLATRNWADLRSWVKTTNLITILVAAATSIVMWLEAERIAHWLSGTDALIISIRAFSVAVVPMTLVKVLSSYFRGMRFSVTPNVVDPFIVPALALVLVVLFSGAAITSVMELYTAGAVVAAAGALIVWLRTFRKVEKAPGRWVVRDALIRSIPIHLTVLGGFATGWITTLVVGASGTEAEVGIYRVAMQYVLVLTLLPQAVDLAMSPQVAALHATDRLHEIARTGRRMVGLTLLLCGIPAVILFIFAEHALAIFGPEFIEGAFTLRLLIAGQIVIFLFGPVGGVMVMTGLERLSLLNATAGSIVAVVSSMILIPRYGVDGAAAASLLTGIFRLIVATVIVWYCRGLFLPLGLTRRRRSPPAAGHKADLEPEL